MALDTFTKSGVTTYTFTRGNTFPISKKYVPNQVKSLSGGGTSKVVGISPAQEYRGINLNNIPLSDLNLLYAFFNDSLVNWGEQIFTWTDNESTVRTVRFWDDELSINNSSSDIYSVSFQLKVEE